VHLTFQEYLAAWRLSNMDFDDVATLIQSRLRLAKWFETLQLLGAQWAEESDDKADRFVAWLLDNRGTTINDQAPVVALCANVVKDIDGVAELTPQTRATFKDAVEATLAAFRKASGVPAKTQVEILEALGQLGAAVKSHLIDATRASLFQVRRRAIEMLLPHLSDDELFDMKHLARDQSQEPIKTYLLALLDRDRDRAVEFIETLSMTGKTSDAISILSQTSFAGRSDASRRLLSVLAVNGNPWHYSSRSAAFKILAERWPDETTRKLITERAVQDNSGYARSAAFKILAEKWPDETTRELLAQRAVQDDHYDPRRAALQALAGKRPDETTRELLTQRAVQDDHEYPRRASGVGREVAGRDHTQSAGRSCRQRRGRLGEKGSQGTGKGTGREVADVTPVELGQMGSVVAVWEIVALFWPCPSPQHAPPRDGWALSHDGRGLPRDS
jgi:hypothetical protein